MMNVKFPARVIILHVLVVLAPLILPDQSYGQDTTKTVPDGTEGDVHEIRGVDSITGKEEKLPMNEFENSYSTFKVGLIFKQDFVNYIQDDVFKQQMDTAGFQLGPTFKVRDFRVLASGLLKTKRTIAWKLAYMYDGDNEKWTIRETGVIIGVPELFGHIFIGRTKEGYSMVKVMSASSAWTMEKQMALDPIPIIADGIKWFGSLPKSRIFWNLGYFNDLISRGEPFSTFSWQYVARVGWMPFYNKEKNKLMHIAANLRYAKPLDGQMTIKSRPESNPTPQLINTGTFQTDKSSHVGAEIYISTGRLMLGSEVMWHNFYSKSAENHQYFGGDVMITYSFTGGIRPYNTRISLYGFMPVKKSVFKGGWGEWEGVLHFSTFNLNDRSIRGGQFWRITPMVNWSLSKVVRMEFVYGYGVLDRYNLKGGVQFFQSRIQFTIM
ncbi:OprO/OprP family phosphate-selective porin [Flavihumibacter profundi]|jgi:phosphate-selective porin OprO and OprP|uniref:OprO/OprP family phosphate-selective porin n=1 Tax=Flavihumibacter profundi TaxID=2716883 RepID=UPI001CC54D13|nr:porin [Flavihumibacter profundi]MBZ5859368.1 OprO/OprP family phosphate-selective porin [Flavihumibacter profundi]